MRVDESALRGEEHEYGSVGVWEGYALSEGSCTNPAKSLCIEKVILNLIGVHDLRRRRMIQNSRFSTWMPDQARA